MLYTIRDAFLADIPAITAIYADAVLHGTATFETTPPDEPEMARRMNDLKKAAFPYFVAEENGEILGYAYAGSYRTRFAYRFTVEDSIYIAPNRKGQGLGKALLAKLISECEALAFRQMVAVIGDEASVGSIKLHQSLGFSHAGLFKDVGFKHGRWLSCVLMQRPLGKGGSELPAPLADDS